MRMLPRWLTLGFLAGGLALTPALASAQGKTVWNLPHIAAPTYYHTVNLKEFANRVQEKTGGKLEIRVHPASSLYPGPEIHLALIDGRAEIGPVLPVYMTDILLTTGVLDLPFMTSSLDEHRKGAEGLRKFFEEELAKKGLVLLAIYSWPSQQLYSTKKPIKTVEDWKGLKVRVYGSESAALTTALGGAPVSVTFGELYTALQRGVVDAAITSATNAIPMKFVEVTKYMNYWYFSGSAMELLAVNKKAWDGLAPDVRNAVTAVIKEMRFEDKEWADNKAWDERAKKEIQEKGMVVLEIPASEIEKARKLARPTWDAWAKRAGEAGPRALQETLRILGR